ncbi:hypothetical protein KAS42_00980 [bacterium]|nr:hypothetical protein [bacterium]
MFVIAFSFILVLLVGMHNSCFCEGADIWDNDASGWTTTFANGDPIDAATGSNAYSPQIAIDSNGIVYTVFYQLDGSFQRIYLCRYDGTDVRIWDNDTLSWTTTFTDGDPIDAVMGRDAYDPQIAIDSSDRVYITYYQSDTYSRIYLNRYDGTNVEIWDNDTSGWTDIFTDGDPIDAATGMHAFSPQIAIDSNGVVYCTYSQHNGTYYSIYLSRYDGTDVEIWDNGDSTWTDTFTDGDPIDAATGSHAFSPQIAIDSSSRVYVTYYQYNGADYGIYLSCYNGTDAEIWDNGASGWTDTFADGDPIDAATGSHAYNPQIAVDSSSRVYVTYHQNDGAANRIYLSRYDGTDIKIWDNGNSEWTDTFTDGDPIDAATGNNAANPEIAIDLNNRAYVIYQQSDGSYNRIYLSRYDGTDVKIWDNGNSEWTDTFADGDPIDPGTESCGNPQLAIDLSNNIYVTYAHQEPASVYLNRYNSTDVRIWDNDTSDWITTFANGDSIDIGSGDSSSAQIAVDLNGVVYVTYMYFEQVQEAQKLLDADFSYYRICLSRYVLPVIAEEEEDEEDERKEKNNPCFIESVLGTAMATDDIIVLRRFRDDTLLTNPVGQIFVSAYYKISPVMAEIVIKHSVLKNTVRRILKPVIWLCEEIIK